MTIAPTKPSSPVEDEDEYWGREIYLEIEERILRTILKRPSLARWKSLCRIMADGVSIAANELDRKILSRGWLCLGALHLATLPLLTKRKNKLPLHEYSIDEKCRMIDAFMPLAKSLVYYLDSAYPKFNLQSGRWGRAGKADELLEPFPFFIARRFNGDDDIESKCEECLFETRADESNEFGLSFLLTGEFFRELAMISDDHDARLWFPGAYAGNITIPMIQKAVAEIDMLKKARKWPPTPDLDSQPTNSSLPPTKVFVVHGHDESLLVHIKRYLNEHWLRPIVLKDEPNTGKTIIEKFEHYSNVDYAIVLLTADDIAHAKRHPDAIEKRGRQNVILEMGYFMGKYGREKLSVLCDTGVTPPGDIDGLVYICTANDSWMIPLERELQSAGLLSRPTSSR